MLKQQYNRRGKTVARILNSAPVHWRAIADAIQEEHDHFPYLTADDLTAQAEHLVRAASYFSARASGRDHLASVRYAQARVSTFRRSAGFTVWKDTLTF